MVQCVITQDKETGKDKNKNEIEELGREIKKRFKMMERMNECFKNQENAEKRNGGDEKRIQVQKEGERRNK